MANYGIDCWPSGCKGECDASAEGVDFENAMAEAINQGWFIGHIHGQGYYVCPLHKDTVFDPILLRVRAGKENHAAK